MPLTANNKAASELASFCEWFHPFLAEFIADAITDGPLSERCDHAVRLSGTHERAFLIWLSAQICEVSWDSVSLAAVAAECFMSSAFTGDDVIDCSGLRWRLPTVWKTWGAGQAWLTAEALHLLAHRALRGQPSASVERFMGAFDSCFAGQLGTLLARRNYSVQEVIESAWKRTGALISASVVAPTFFRSDSFFPALLEFGHAFGIGLQLVDDIYDFAGEESQMGKPLFGDLLHGHPNLVLAFAFQSPHSTEKKKLLGWFGAGSAESLPEPQQMLAAVRRLGALELASQEVNRWLNRAESALGNLPNSEGRSVLYGLLGVLRMLPR